MNPMELIFILSLLVLLYVYLGYPLAVWILSRLFPRPIGKSDHVPSVTIIIAAHNEEEVLEATLENKLILDYPREKLEILVVSDGSVDRTDEIVRSFSARGIRLLRQEPRTGKTSALNLAVSRARGEILVFSDANSLYAPDALRRLVENFADPQVGYVTGRMVYSDPDGTIVGDGCGAYMRYENFLRRIETRLGSVVGVDGGIDAVRASLYRPMKLDQLPDFVLPLSVVLQGYRVVYEPEALLTEPALRESADEYRMRVRVSLRALWALHDMRRLLSFRRQPLFAWQLWSHKVLRYLCFPFLASAYLSNAFLWGESDFYSAFFLFQNLAYGLAFLSLLLERRGVRLRILYFSHYFVLLNLAAAHAFLKFILGQRQVVWVPRRG